MVAVWSSWSRQRKTPAAHYLDDLFAMYHGPRSIPLCIQHHIQLTSLSFQVSRPSHSWDNSNFKIWPWKSKVDVIPEGHIVGTTPYQLISLSFDVDEPSHSYLLLLKNLTLKIQGQGQGWGERWKSHHGSNILSTHIPFVPSQSAIPFLRYSIFRLCPWKSKVKVMGEANAESQHGSNIISTHIPFVPCQSAIPFLRYNFF